MTLLGLKVGGINFTVCSQFQPTVLDGQLCYSLNLSTLEKRKTKTGKRYGLVLLLDSIGQKSEELEKEAANMESALDLEFTGVDDHSPKIYLNILSSFTDYNVGSYAMTSLKKMTGTESFLKQTNEQKKCRIGTFEDCQAKSYIDTVQKKCGCVPWALTSSSLVSKV